MENTTASKGVKRMLSLDLDSWNLVMLVSLGVAAIAAVAVVISTTIVIKLQKQEAMDSAEAFAQYKVDAGVRIAEASEGAAKANERAAEANLELERLKAPRSLPAEQKTRIRGKLKALSGTTFEVVTYPGEPESVAFSNIIAETLSSAGWVFNPNGSRGSLLGLASGVVVVVGKHAGAKADEAGNVLLEALISEGVSAKLGHDSLQINPVAIAIQVQVAKKP